MLDTLYGKFATPLNLNTTTTTNTTPTARAIQANGRSKRQRVPDRETETQGEISERGKIVSASQFNEELLKLEIAALEKRLAKKYR